MVDELTALSRFLKSSTKMPPFCETSYSKNALSADESCTPRGMETALEKNLWRMVRRPSSIVVNTDIKEGSPFQILPYFAPSIEIDMPDS